MAAPDDDEKRRLRDEYVGFVIDGYHGYEIPMGLQQQAENEWDAFPDYMAGNFSRMISEAASHQRQVDAAFRRLDDEFITAKRTWDGMTGELQAAERVILKRYFDECGTISVFTNEYWRTAGAMLLDPENGLHVAVPRFLQSMVYRADKVRALWIDTREREPDVTNPTQLPRGGVRVLGRHRRPKATIDLVTRQTQPPAPTVFSQPIAPVANTLPPAPGNSWIGTPLGQGGMGSTRVFSERDAAGQVVRRIVVKDTTPALTNEMFEMPTYWYGDLSQAGWKTSTVPMEYHIQKIAGDAPQIVNSVRVIGAPQINWAQRAFRIYMEFAPEGDLEQLQDRHWVHNEPVPERFLWVLLSALLDACMVLKQGGLDNPSTPWSEIVHCDLKPPNVFLSSAGNTFPQWPTIKLGDFGLAFMTSQADATNPSIWIGCGTPGFLAPEQVAYRDGVTKQPLYDHKLLSPCNVWGIAKTLTSLMLLTHFDAASQSSFLDGNNQTLDAYTRTLYSEELCDMVDQCMQTDPTSRPKIEDVKEFMDDRLASLDWAPTRQGVVGPEDDTLLWPKHPVRLKWASRMNDGLAGLGQPRVPRVPNSNTSTVYGDA